MPHIAYKIHVQQSIYIQFLYILQTPYLTIYIYFLSSLHILKHIKIFFQEHITKAISYGRHKFIMLKVLMEGKNL